jgi:hypothetical protein
MRVLAAMILGLAVCVALWSSAGAGEKGKEVTLKGKITCPKCDVGTETKCWTIIIVKGDDKKEKTYWFDKAANKKYHADICMGSKEGTVVGVVDAKDEKKLVITVKKLDYK